MLFNSHSLYKLKNYLLSHFKVFNLYAKDKIVESSIIHFQHILLFPGFAMKLVIPFEPPLLPLFCTFFHFLLY